MRQPTDYEEGVYAASMREFAQLQAWRATFASMWEETAELIAPNFRNTFFYGNFNFPGQKKTDRQVDSSGMMALTRFGAIVDSLLTPRNEQWHMLTANNKDVMKDRNVRLWFEQATDILFKHRYSSIANFTSQNQANYQQLGAFGNMGMFIDEFDSVTHPTKRGIRYKAMPVGEMFLRENHQGMVDGFCRWFRMTAQQALQKFGEESFPEVLRAPLEQNSPMLFDFLHRVCPRDDYDPERLDEKGKPYASYYISVQGKVLLREGGYRMMPAAIGRYNQAPGEVYGRGPAQDVLPALKTLNAEKRTFLKQGHRAADPVLLAPDDGIMDFSMRPGAVNKGGMNQDGKMLVGVLPTGNIQISKEMMDEEKGLINDAFLVSLFQILTETPQMTATEVIERVNEKGILIAPTIGRQQSEYLGPMIERELDVLSAQGLLPPMPPLLREAQGEYQIVYDSPLTRFSKAPRAAGFMRTLETVKELVSITQDMSMLDPFNFDAAIPEIAHLQGTPESWMSTPDQIQAKRQARAQQAERQAEIQEAPAKAAMMKAQAALAKSGQPMPGAQQPAGPGEPLAQQLGG